MEFRGAVHAWALVLAVLLLKLVHGSVAKLLFLSRQAVASCDQLSLAQVLHIITFTNINKLLLYIYKD